MKPEDNDDCTDSMTLAEWVRGGWDGNDNEENDETGGS